MANTKQMTVTISPSLHKKITRAAKKEGISMSELVRKALNGAVKK